ncbi:hypothetical protein FRC17_010444 [Serendipita sp. 399]|nr:hypothetical protein FRC17_010444 [Serendipita sp. 399]
MTEFSRTLNIINRGDLPDDTTLMLSFQPIEGLYKETYPVCWRVGTFAADAPGAMVVTYKNQLAYSRPQVINGNIVAVSTWVNLNVGQKTTLTKDSGPYKFSPPTSGEKNYLIAENDTGSIQEMAIGFTSQPGMPPSSVLYFDKIGTGSNVTTQFTPVLTAYVTSQYQQTQILKGAIQTPAIWKQDLAELSESTTLIFSRDKATGRYSLEIAGSV